MKEIIEDYKRKIRFEETKMKQEKVVNGRISADRIARLSRIIEYHQQIEKIRTEQIEKFLNEFVIYQ